MNRVLRTTGQSAGEGLLKRALELRNAARLKAAEPSGAQNVALEPAGLGEVDAEKKKPSQRYWKKAA